MKRKLRVLTPLVATMLLVGAASAAWAADPKPNENAVNALAWLMLLLPTFFIIAVLIVFARKSGAMKQGSYLVKANEHMDRYSEHMVRMEEKTDQMIQLLKSIEHLLREGA